MFSNLGRIQVMDMSQGEQKYLVSISKLQCLAHAPLGLGKVILCFRTMKNTRDINQNIVFGSQSLSFTLAHPVSPSFSLTLYSPNVVFSGRADQTWGVNSNNPEEAKHEEWKMDLLAPFHLLLFSSPSSPSHYFVNQLGLVKALI